VSALLGPERLDFPFGLGKIAPGGFPDVTYVQIIHGILLAATCRLRRARVSARFYTGCGKYRIVADGPVSQILRSGSKAPFKRSTYGKQRTYAVSDVNCVPRARITGTRWTHLLCGLSLLAATVFFAGVSSAQEQRHTYRIPFHTVNGVVLLDAKVNDKPAVGADRL